MPFAFIVFGLVLLVAGVRGQSQNLFVLMRGDLTGSNSFLFWFVSILLIGSVGYVDSLKPLSRSFLALILIVLVIDEDKNGSGGFFAEFQSAMEQITGKTVGLTGIVPIVNSSGKPLE